MTVTLLAHGGVGGAIVAILVILGIVGLVAATWLRERRYPGAADEPTPDAEQEPTKA